MSIKEDAAVKLNEAYEAALITPHPVCRHGEFIDYQYTLAYPDH